MVDYIATILIAVPGSIGIGFGVELGKELYHWTKIKIKQYREKILLNKIIKLNRR